MNHARSSCRAAYTCSRKSSNSSSESKTPPWGISSTDSTERIPFHLAISSSVTEPRCGSWADPSALLTIAITSSQCSMHQYGIHGAVWSHSSQEPTVAANTIEHEQHLLEAVCPNRQRYAPIRRRKRIQPETTSQVKVRGAEGNRTPDLCHAKAALYQLSYSPVWACARPATSVVPRGLGRGRVCRTAAVDRRAAELAAVRCGGLAPEV